MVQEKLQKKKKKKIKKKNYKKGIKTASLFVVKLKKNIYVVHCWLINPNKLNLLSWLLAYLSDKSSAWHQTFCINI